MLRLQDSDFNDPIFQAMLAFFAVAIIAIVFASPIVDLVATCVFLAIAAAIAINEETLRPVLLHPIALALMLGLLASKVDPVAHQIALAQFVSIEDYNFHRDYLEVPWYDSWLMPVLRATTLALFACGIWLVRWDLGALLERLRER
jgi:hypothetical protein